MAKGVLGNDPFVRGAPARGEAAIKTDPEATAAPKPASAAKPRLPPRPPVPGSHGGSKSASKSKPARQSAKQKASKSEHRKPVLGVPLAQLGDWAPTSHADSPQMVVINKVATPHPGSSEMNLRLGSADEAGKFVPHPNSPELKAVFRAGIISHQDSPQVQAVIDHQAVAHRGSPEVVADLHGREPVPHARSPDAVELHESAARRPIVVEIVEQVSPEVPMSDREIAAVPRASRQALALRVAREVFSGGIVRPLASAASGLFHAARTALGISGANEFDVWGKDLSLTRALEPLSDFLYDRYFRVTVEGADHVPSGASILVANHSGALPLDGPMLQLALRRERADLPDARWLMEDQVFHAPFIGVLANRLGAVRANPENATRLLEEKRPVAVFPEGIQGISKKFGERYKLKRFGRGGYVKLAVRLSVPIVPVAIVGAEESMPLLARVPGGIFGLPYLPITLPPLPAKWHIRFGPPMDLSHAPTNAAEDLAWVAHTNDRTRETIEGMLTSMLRTRTSVF